MAPKIADPRFFAILIAALTVAPLPVLAQSDTATAPASTSSSSLTPEERLRSVAERIDKLMEEMATQAANDEQLIADIQQRKINIEQADARITEMIARLNEVTANMQDDSELSQALTDFEALTIDLIAEAEASGDEAMMGAIPDLRKNLEKLKATENLRSSKVQEARALIRNLEDNKSRIAFFYKAGQVQKAAEQLESSVKGYAAIVDGAQAIADTVLTDIAAR